MTIKSQLNKFTYLCLILLLSLFSIIFAQEDDEFEFDDDEFEFDDDEFEGLDDFEFEDDDFDALMEEFEIEEEEEEYEAEDRKLSIGIIAGNWMPFGSNIAGKFESGTHFGINIQFPFGFYFGPFEVIFGSEISIANMDGNYDQWINPDSTGYSLTNILMTASTKILFLDARIGVGISPSTGPDAVTGEPVSASLPSITVDAIYKVPFNLGPISIDFKFRAQESLGVPGEDAGTSDMISFGTVINYNF